MERLVRRPTMLTALAAVAIGVLMSMRLAEGPADQRPETPPAPAGAPVAVVIGDSFTSGSSENSGPEWPQLLGASLGWRVVPEGVPGTGYLGNGGETFGERLDEALAHPADVFLVAGGYNDLRDPPAHVAAAAADVVRRLTESAPEARVVLVSPFSNGDPRPAIVAQASALREVAEAHDVMWVDATRFLPSGQGLIGGDGVHPTDAGHRRLAAELEEALVEAGFPSGGR